ncbi:sigma 54-interacting transcriptional regulator [Hymenobacter sediminicola]|uniref:Sigma-54-dependent Fis family transcriptional regulator n=1 Tax=Hymenobacter sediminicola TaxID=2761579 RepID=A0A7G7W8T6_9BACT|nr:sigma-54 dependent transcriptional regulator [Hymenobacter sediminicola]QNH62779.1 sigma-54-dependent Fis family transcriptional regulator [Hymenobacter sediminicola]
MAHSLISWIARNNDFDTTPEGLFNSVNLNGPNIQFHEHFFTLGGFDEHILLYADAKQELWAEHLLTFLRRQHPERQIRTELLALTNVIDLAEIKTKVETWLLHLTSHEITLFFSPGTPIMQLAWYICHTTLGLNTHLVQTRAGKFSPDKLPALMRLDVERSTVPVTAIIRERQLKLGASTSTETAHLIGDSLQTVYRRAGQVAQTDNVTVLIRGESGTGKEHLAHYVHQQSARRKGPFRALNCAALADTLLESRLFGHRKGAFTGADRDTEGEFKAAEGGTLFLDEIGDISPALQVTLLRVLQSDEIQPLGGEPHKVNVRVVAATHAHLEQQCEQGLFRWDLYYRLAIAELELPPLREWSDKEREALVSHLIQKQQRALHKPQPLQFSDAARRVLMAHSFPGNVRELENLITRLYIFSPINNPLVQPEDLPSRLRTPTSVLAAEPLLLKDVVRAHAVRALTSHKGIKAQAATALGIDVRTLNKALKSG